MEDHEGHRRHLLINIRSDFVSGDISYVLLYLIIPLKSIFRIPEADL